MWWTKQPAYAPLSDWPSPMNGQRQPFDRIQQSEPAGSNTTLVPPLSAIHRSPGFGIGQNERVSHFDFKIMMRFRNAAASLLSDTIWNTCDIQFYLFDSSLYHNHSVRTAVLRNQRLTSRHNRAILNPSEKHRVSLTSHSYGNGRVFWAWMWPHRPLWSWPHHQQVSFRVQALFAINAELWRLIVYDDNLSCIGNCACLSCPFFRRLPQQGAIKNLEFSLERV